MGVTTYDPDAPSFFGFLARPRPKTFTARLLDPAMAIEDVELTPINTQHRDKLLLKLDILRADADRLVFEIADRQETLRQVRISIKAFETAAEMLKDDDTQNEAG
jgi:hypothetical protein